MAQHVLGDLVDVTFVYDPGLGSPPETQPLGGKVIAVPPTVLPLPQRGTLLGQAGFGRQQAVADPLNPGSTVVRWEWVLQGATDPVDPFVDALTGRPGWLVPASRATVKLLIQRLYSAGIPRATIQSQVPQLYQAIAAEIRAEDAPSPA